MKKFLLFAIFMLVAMVSHAQILTVPGTSVAGEFAGCYYGQTQATVGGFYAPFGFVQCQGTAPEYVEFVFGATTAVTQLDKGNCILGNLSTSAGIISFYRCGGQAAQGFDFGNIYTFARARVNGEVIGYCDCTDHLGPQAAAFVTDSTGEKVKFFMYPGSTQTEIWGAFYSPITRETRAFGNWTDSMGVHHGLIVQAGQKSLYEAILAGTETMESYDYDVDHNFGTYLAGGNRNCVIGSYYRGDAQVTRVGFTDCVGIGKMPFAFGYGTYPLSLNSNNVATGYSYTFTGDQIGWILPLGD